MIRYDVQIKWECSKTLTPGLSSIARGSGPPIDGYLTCGECGGCSGVPGGEVQHATIMMPLSIQSPVAISPDKWEEIVSDGVRRATARAASIPGSSTSPSHPHYVKVRRPCTRQSAPNHLGGAMHCLECGGQSITSGGEIRHNEVTEWMPFMSLLHEEIRSYIPTVPAVLTCDQAGNEVECFGPVRRYADEIADAPTDLCLTHAVLTGHLGGEPIQVRQVAE